MTTSFASCARPPSHPGALALVTSLLLATWSVDGAAQSGVPTDSGAATAAGAGPASVGTTAPPPVRTAEEQRADAAKPKLEWHYPTFRTGEYIATGVFAAFAVGGLAIPTTTARWTSSNPIDDAGRDALRLDQLGGRKTADDISDLTLTVSLNYVLFDSLIVTWLGYGKASVAYQMTAIDFETLALTNAVTSVVKGVTARERPYGPECRDGGELARTDDCHPSSLNRSFFSGHTSTSFAAASLTCMHHAYLPLYGGGAGDVAACAGAYAVAATTGVLRVMSDNHNLTDVTVGAAFGTAAGLGIPWLLHYREEAPPPDGIVARRDEVTIHLIPGPLSAAVVGEF